MKTISIRLEDSMHRKMREKDVASSPPKLAILFLTIAMIICALPMSVFAASEKTEVAGKAYEFDKDSHYELEESGAGEKTGNSNTYGRFYISGSVSEVSEESKVPSYEVSDGNLEFYYNYGDTLLNAGEDEWHLVNDKSKKVAGMKLSSDIGKGAIIIQTSKDRENWVDVDTICNAFDSTPIRTSSIYTTTDVQLINGCYYRVVVAYKLAIRTKESNFLFINRDEYDYKKCAEVYEFYAYRDSSESDGADLNQTYSLGTKVKAKNFDGYFGEKLIDEDDIHYGWDIGNFFVSGYTDEVKADDGNMVFLKNVGDKVTLWFKLNQNIDSLNQDKDLSVTADGEGYDQYFETKKMDFGRGALIIRYTDYNNVKAEPTIYTNYLEANASVDADTKVQLFEEGDYEVALDYEVTRNELIDKIGHYRIFFRFSVRNGNCMVYPFDVKTGSELTNSSMTENGFRLDLAKSRYLKINLKRETLKDSADGLVEDTRFNGSAKDGAEYTEEGIYTITVSNEYTGQFTTKKIYVGTNNLLRAYMTTGLSIQEIKDLMEDGATISDDGTIQLTAAKSVEDKKESEKETRESSSQAVSSDAESVSSEESKEEEPATGIAPIAVISCILVCAVLVIGIALKTRKKKRKKEGKKERIEAADDRHDEGGAEH